MIARHKLCLVAVAAWIVAVAGASSALAFCSSCSGSAAPAYSVGYAAPVTYSAAYAPTYTTAYAPTYTTYYRSGWNWGGWWGRSNRSVWGTPTTTYYAPVYTAGYATTAYYAPSVAYAAPTCSTCTASYAPACSTCGTCSTCTASYAPACSACSTCGGCSSCDAGVITTAGVATVSSGCPSCSAGTVTQSTYLESTPSSSTSTTSTTEPSPTLAPNANVAPERTLQQADKPITPEPAADAGGAGVAPGEHGSTSTPTSGKESSSESGGTSSADDPSAQFEAPKLLDPNDRTAARHMAPVWTAVYHKVNGAAPAAQAIAHQRPTTGPSQEELDAAGWASAGE